jgi:hypothetical protein
VLARIWEFWRRSVGLDVGRTGTTVSSGHAYSIAFLLTLSAEVLRVPAPARSGQRTIACVVIIPLT